jgi:alkylhydroperoxidase/carboxymuconolactone decarboxylase family protein YurZ
MALRDSMTFEIQAKAELCKSELTAEQLRDVLDFAMHYVGYPRAAPLIGVIEKCIAEVARERKEG